MIPSFMYCFYSYFAFVLRKLSPVWKVENCNAYILIGLRYSNIHLLIPIKGNVQGLHVDKVLGNSGMFFI